MHESPDSRIVQQIRGSCAPAGKSSARSTPSEVCSSTAPLVSPVATTVPMTPAPVLTSSPRRTASARCVWASGTKAMNLPSQAICKGSKPNNSQTDAILSGPCDGWQLERPQLPDTDGWEIDTAPLATAIWHDVCAQKPAAEIAARFHQTLVAIIVETASRIGLPSVVLGGGCFQNALLLEAASTALSARGHQVLLPQQFPANDGGLAAGQAFAGCWLRPLSFCITTLPR